MNVRTSDVLEAMKAAGVDPAQASAVISALESRPAGNPAFNFANVAYYLGGFLVIGAMTFFMSLTWSWGSIYIFVLSLMYALFFATVGIYLYARPETMRPGGILVTAAVCMVPLIVYSLEEATGFWVGGGQPFTYHGFYEWVHQSWVLMEIATIFAGLVAMRFVPFGLITLPIAFSLWFLSMDSASLLFPGAADVWERNQRVSLWFGVIMLLGAMSVDRRNAGRPGDFAFWGYLYGAAALYFGLGILWNRGPAEKALFCAISVFILLLSIVLGRRALTVFGASGVFAYVSYLSWEVFKDSLTFPFVLTLIGLATIGLGVFYQRNEESIRDLLRSSLPKAITDALPPSRA